MRRTVAWIVSAAVLVALGLFVTHLYLTIPASEAAPVLVGAVLAVVLVFLVFVVSVYVHDVIQDRRYRDDPDEHLEHLRSGGTQAEKRMVSHLRAIGFLPARRVSQTTRKVMAALDASRPRRSWLRKALRALRQAVRDLVTAFTITREVPRGGRHAAPKGHVAPYFPPDPEPVADIVLLPRMAVAPVAAVFPLPPLTLPEGAPQPPTEPPAETAVEPLFSWQTGEFAAAMEGEGS